MEKTQTLNILLVDDDEALLKIYQNALFNSGFRVETIDEIDQAIKLISQKKYDVVFCDMKMNYLDENDDLQNDGGQYIIRLTKKVSPLTKIVIITAYGSLDIARGSFKEGVYDFLEKNDDLIEEIHKILRSIKDERRIKLTSPNVLQGQEKYPFFIELEENSFQVYIDKNWSVSDFLDFFQAINNIYSFIHIVTPELEMSENFERDYLKKLWIALENGIFETQFNKLKVKKIKYASPGEINFKGLSDIVAELRHLLLGILTIGHTIKKNKLKRKELELELEKKKHNLEIQKQLAELNLEEERIRLFNSNLKALEMRKDLLKERGYPNSEIESLMANVSKDVNLLIFLAEEGKIVKST